jgi:SAM-dependent methyltransferase
MAEVEYGRLSLWRDPASFDDALGRERAARLEFRGQAAEEIQTRAAYLDLVGIGPGDRVLEVGCGSGVVLRELARRVAPDGRAVGIDLSSALLQIAREHATEAGLDAVVELREGDARSLPFADGEFDAVLAVTSLCHIPEGERAVPEMVRVTRPGGTVGVFDIDGDSLIIAHPDRALTRRIVAARSDHSQVDSWLARRLPGLFADAGLHTIRVRAFTPFDGDPKGFNAGLAETGAAVAAQVGAITEAERDRWLDQLHAEQAAGRSVAGLTYLFIWATVPQHGV